MLDRAMIFGISVQSTNLNSLVKDELYALNRFCTVNVKKRSLWKKWVNFPIFGSSKSDVTSGEKLPNLAWSIFHMLLKSQESFRSVSQLLHTKMIFFILCDFAMWQKFYFIPYQPWQQVKSISPSCLFSQKQQTHPSHAAAFPESPVSGLFSQEEPPLASRVWPFPGKLVFHI